ncbi:MAG: hypothetical protein J0L92_22990 [Deltaproteobacteria bacterium]|nr:hypothetical protein [Deltaproteobacteria bacterium]
MKQRTKTATGAALGIGTTFCLALSLGCAAIDPMAGDVDASAVGRGDAFASAPDGGPGTDSGGLLGVPEGESADPDTNAASCFDGIDQDRDEVLDCDEDSCRTSRICCVGSTDVDRCCEPVARATEIALSDCAVGAPDACLELDARTISGAPIVSIDHSLVPVSGAGIDGAVDFPALELQPRGEAITLRARIGSPATTAQLDATAFGLWVPTLPTTQVTPLVAVVVSATRDDVSIVSGSRVIARHTRPAGIVEYTLSIEPTGVVNVSVGDTALSPVSITLPASPVVPVVFGRVANDDGTGETTRLHGLAVERRACDLPNALGRMGEVTPEPTAGLDLRDAADPSVLVREAATTLVAFTATSGVSNDERSIFVGTLEDEAVTSVRMVLDVVGLEAALASSGLTLDVTALAGPHLYADGTASDAVVRAYFAYRTDDLAWHIGRLANVLDETGLEVSRIDLGLGSFDDPALLPDGRLIVREHTASSTHLVVFDVSAETPARADSLCEARGECDDTTERTDSFVLAPSDDSFAFDRDEVAAPFALRHGGVTRIYYAGRRGTRWSLGVLLQSADGAFFRPANDATAVLAPTGQGGDSLGTFSPSVHVEGEELVVLYAGTDGAHSRLLSARMPIRSP